MGLLHWNLYFKLFTGGLLAYSVLMLAFVFVMALRRSKICRERNSQLHAPVEPAGEGLHPGRGDSAALHPDFLPCLAEQTLGRQGATCYWHPDRAGDNGIPDLAVSFWTQGQTVNS